MAGCAPSFGFSDDFLTFMAGHVGLTQGHLDEFFSNMKAEWEDDELGNKW